MSETVLTDAQRDFLLGLRELTMRTGVPNTSIWRACSNHGSPIGMVPFDEAKITSKKYWPL